MKLNIHMILDELKAYMPRLTTFRDIDCNLSQIRILEFPCENLRQDCIYLLEASDFEKHGHLLQGVDLISIGHIDSRNEMLSVISLMEDCDKMTIFNMVQDVFEKHERWDYDLMRSIAAKESLQAIADKAASILANPFSILDVAMKRILIGGTVPDHYKGTIWEIVLENEYTPSETYTHSADELYFYLNYGKKPYFRFLPPYAQYSHLVANLYLDGKLFALLCTTDIIAPLTQGQVSLVQHIRDVMELAVASSTEIKDSSESVVYYLENLIKGLYVDEKILSFHLVKRGWKTSGYFCVFVISNPDGREISDSQAKFCIFRMKKLQDDAILFSYENFIIGITRQSKSEEHEKYKEELAALLTSLSLHCGCSQIFSRFSDLKYFYIQSKAALYEGEKNSPESVLWSFDDCYFSHVISSLDHSTSLKAMCHPSILHLYEHDKANGTDYVKCLRIYLSNGLNIAQSGKELFMHRNTLVYRLEKIADLMEMDIQQLNENARMQLWFSCLLCSRL